MSIRFIMFLAAAALVSGSGIAATAQKPHISMKVARSKALRDVPHGTVKSAELETEKGKLIYSFDIIEQNKPGVEEIQISAIDGKLVSRKHETAVEEKNEARAEPKEHKRK